VLEVSDSTRKCEIFGMEVNPVRPDDGFAHQTTRTQ
jgi:hypothetical protein